jgi:hypothetical protein
VAPRRRSSRFTLVAPARGRARLAAFAALALAAAACARATTPPPVTARAPLGADSATAERLASGVLHRRLVINGVPWVIHVLEVDLRGDAQVRAEHAFGRLDGRERTSDLARRIAGDSLVPLAAVNADFFSLATGEVLGNQVVEGRLVAAVSRAMNPARPPRSQFALTRDRRPLIEQFTFEGAAIVGRDTLPLAGVNVPPVRNTLVLRLAPAPDTVPADTLRDARALPISRAGRDTTTYVEAGPLVQAVDARMPPGGALLVARGPAAARLERALGRDTARVPVRITRALVPARGALRTLVGGWGRLVVDGQSVADSTWAQEGAQRSFVVSRHPRTAVGFSRDSSTLYLVTVDGRQARSAGMTLAELASTMRGLGAWQAMNLDGGGSTTMVVRGAVVNSPSDTTGERPVGNALVVMRKR